MLDTKDGLLEPKNSKLAIYILCKKVDSNYGFQYPRKKTFSQVKRKRWACYYYINI